jgi:nucleotide-binding universal stress UspA family protein
MTEQPDTTTHDTREVVVGIDESKPARTALAAAIEEAARRSAPLRVVTVFESAGRFGARYSVPIPVDDAEIARREEDVARKIVDDVLSTAAARPEVRVTAIPGTIGPTLVEQSRNAQLLVVGHRGHGEITSVLLGSVGLYCVLHAHSPVLVVRPDSS